MENLIDKNLVLSPLGFIIYLLAALALGWTLYGLRGYRHWVKRFNRYHSLPHRRRLRHNYGYVEYVPSVLAPRSHTKRAPSLPFVPPRTDEPTIVHRELPSATKDDLQVVEGIGPKTEAILNEHGIHTWRELSVTPIHNLQAMLSRAGKQFEKYDPSTWPHQAQLAYEGKWNELKEYQGLFKETSE